MMGVYLNSKTAYTLYKRDENQPYFVDKTSILEELLPLIEEGGNQICITRPRRYGIFFYLFMTEMIQLSLCLFWMSGIIFFIRTMLQMRTKRVSVFPAEPIREECLRLESAMTGRKRNIAVK